MDMNQLIAKYNTYGISKVLSRLAKDDEEGSYALDMAVDLRSALESYVGRYGK